MPAAFRSVPLPDSWDWRTQDSVVTSVKDQGACNACYAFPAIGNIESSMLISETNTYSSTNPPDFSENNVKECTWRERNDYLDAQGNPWGGCAGGNDRMVVSHGSQNGVADEEDDPYVANDTGPCNTSVPYQHTLLGYGIISGDAVPSTDALKTYIQTHGPVYTSMYAGDGDAWETEFSDYDGSYTLNYTGPATTTNHAALIVGWDDSLPYTSTVGLDDSLTQAGTGGWIVKNSWGTGWGGPCGYGAEGGYFTIAYGSANIGKYSSFIYDWQDYDPTGGLMYYDDDGGWVNAFGCDTTTAWGLVKFFPPTNANVTRVEFWTHDITTDVDLYIYDDFDGTEPSNLLWSSLNNSFDLAGYHGVVVDPPLPVTSGDDVIAVVRFTNSSYTFPVASDPNGSIETNLTYISCSGSSGSWTEMGAGYNNDVAIRLRTSGGPSPTATPTPTPTPTATPTTTPTSTPTATPTATPTPTPTATPTVYNIYLPLVPKNHP